MCTRGKRSSREPIRRAFKTAVIPENESHYLISWSCRSISMSISTKKFQTTSERVWMRIYNKSSLNGVTYSSGVGRSGTLFTSPVTVTLNTAEQLAIVNGFRAVWIRPLDLAIWVLIPRISINMNATAVPIPAPFTNQTKFGFIQHFITFVQLGRFVYNFNSVEFSGLFLGFSVGISGRFWGLMCLWRPTRLLKFVPAFKLGVSMGSFKDRLLIFFTNLSSKVKVEVSRDNFNLW